MGIDLVHWFFGQVPYLGFKLFAKMRLVSLEIKEMLCGGFVDTVFNFIVENYRKVRITLPEAWLQLEIVSNLLCIVNYISAVTKDALMGKFKLVLVYGVLGYRCFGMP